MLTKRRTPSFSSIFFFKRVLNKLHSKAFCVGGSDPSPAHPVSPTHAPKAAKGVEHTFSIYAKVRVRVQTATKRFHVSGSNYFPLRNTPIVDRTQELQYYTYTGWIL